jgi:hypothetical protein
MPVATLSAPDGRFIDVQYEEGTTDEQIIAFAQQQYALDPSIAYDEDDSSVIEKLQDLETEDLIDAASEAGKRFYGGVKTGAYSTGLGLQRMLPDVAQEAFGIDEESLAPKDLAYREEVARDLGFDPQYNQTFLADVASGAGELLPLATSAFLTRGASLKAGLSPTLSRFATGVPILGQTSAITGREAFDYEQRTGETISDEQDLLLKGRDVGLAYLEQRLGILDNIFKGLPKGWSDTLEGSQWMTRLKSAFGSFFSEGSQEVIEGLIRDVTDKNIYDPERAIGEGIQDDFTVGGTIGALYDLAIGSLRRRNPPKLVEAPEEIAEPTDEEIEIERGLREEQRNKETKRRKAMDRALRRTATPVDIEDSSLIDPDLSVQEMVGAINQSPQILPTGVNFQVEQDGSQFFVTQDGVQFGPPLKDPIKAEELKAALNEASDNKRLDKILNDAGERALNQAVERGDLSVEAANALKRGAELEAAARANPDYIPPDDPRQDILRQHSAQTKAKTKRLYQFLRQAGRAFTPEDPATPRLDRGQKAATPVREMRRMEKRIDTAFNRLGIRNKLNSVEGAGVIQTIVGRPVSEKAPLQDLTRSEQEYILRTLEQAPPLVTPRGVGVDQVDPVTGVTVPSRPRMEQTVSIPNFAARAEPVRPDVPSEPIPADRQLVPFESEEAREQALEENKAALEERAIESAVGKQLQKILESVGLSEEFAVRAVKEVGTARRDSEGNVYIRPRKKDPDADYVTLGSAQVSARVIQISIDGIKMRVDQGMSFEEATARVMNHEILHALRGLDLFTAKEFSLLERLSRQYSKPKEGMTYGQWAVQNYPDLDAVSQQEEAIAEMISDSLTGGVLIDGNFRQLSGKPRSLIQRIVEFFKELVGFAQNNDINSYQELVNAIQTGEVGRRDPTEIRTLVETERQRQEIEERSITKEELQLRTGTRPSEQELQRIAQGIENDIRQAIGDAPVVVSGAELQQDDAREARAMKFPKKAQTAPRLARAIEQGFDVSKVYYHGTSVPDIRRFDGNVGMGVVAGHFTSRPSFANRFAPTITIPEIGQIPTVYPVFLRYGEQNEAGGIADIRSLIQDDDNPVRLSLNTPLSRQPRLKADLEMYFAAQLERGRLSGPYNTKLKSFEQMDLARFYYDGTRSLESVAEDLAEDFHNNAAQGAYAEILETPYDVDFAQLEVIAPYIKEAGFKGYFDIEEAGKQYSGIAMFNSNDIKGVFADFDPDAVPEGMMYEDDIMFSRVKGAPDRVQTSLPLRKPKNQPEIVTFLDPTDPLAVISTEKILADEKLKEKIASSIRDYNFLPDSVKQGTDEEVIEALKEHAKSNLMWLHGQMNPEVRAIAKKWYDGARKLTERWADRYGIEPRQAAAVIANLSPQKDWFMNMSLAERILDIQAEQQNFKATPDMDEAFERTVLDGKKKPPQTPKTAHIRLAFKLWNQTKDATLAEVPFRVKPEEAVLAESIWIRMFDEAHNPRSYRAMAPTGQILDFVKKKNGENAKVAWGSFTEIGKAVAATKSADLDVISRGLGEAHKVRNFYNNIVSPNSRLGEVTIDTHAVAAALFKPLSGKGFEVFHAFGTTPSVEVLGMPSGVVRRGAGSSGVNGSQGTYGIYADAYREAAKELGILPRELQSITWEEIRVIYPDTFKDGKGNLSKINSLWDQYASGKLSIDEVRDAAYEIADTKGNKPSWFGRSRTGRLRSKSDTTYDRGIPLAELSRQGLEGVDAGRGDIGDTTLKSKRKIDPAKIEKAVQQNQQEAEENGLSVPRHSVKASPEAQYIGRNPDAGIEPETILESRAPNYNKKTQSFINRLVEGTPTRADPMTQYMDVTGENSTLEYKLTQAKQAAVNRYARLEKLNQKYFKDYLADSSSIAAVLFADRSSGVMAEAIKTGVPQYKNGLTKVVDFFHNGKQYRGLIDIMDVLRTKKHGDLTEFAQAYAIAMRGKRLNEAGKPTPVSQKDIDEAKENIRQFTDADGYNPIVEWYGAWQAYNNKVITFLEDTGVVDQKGAESWRLASDYIPFYRALEPDYKITNPAKHPFGDLTKLGAFRPYKGKTDKINVPLVESIVKNTAAAIDLGMRNVAQQRIARDMQKLQLAKQVPASKKGTAGVVGFKVRGEPVFFQIYDHLIFESMTAIDSSGLEDISRIFFGPASNLLRETVTRTPGFMLVNMLRDSLSAFVTSGARFLPFFSTFKGFASDISNLERTGVVGGYDFGFGRIRDQGIGDMFREESKRRNRKGLPLNMFKTLWDAAGRATTRSDAATRQAVYNDVYARTGNEAEAHFQAMEVLNFSRRGSDPRVRAITTAIPFLNARLQGLDVLWRSFLGVNTAKRGVPRGTAALSFAMRGALISFATMLYWMASSDDERYLALPPEVRDNNWVFFIPGLDFPVTIPIPFEVGLIFKTIPEVALNASFDKVTERQALESFKRGIGSTLELNLLYGVQAWAPILEAQSNYSNYTGRPIVPIWLTGLRPEMRKTDSTSEVALFLQEATPYLSTIPMLGVESGGVSPIKIDHVIKGYTGSTGAFILNWTDRVMRSKEGREALANAGYKVTQPDFPEMALYEFPLAKRMFLSPQASGLTEQFYDLAEEVKQTYNTLRELEDRGEYEEAQSLLSKTRGLLAIKQDVYEMRKTLADIREQERQIRRSPEDVISASQKREMLDELIEYRNYVLAVVPALEKIADRPMIRGTE